MANLEKLEGVENKIDLALKQVCYELQTNRGLNVIEANMLKDAVADLGSARTLIKSSKIIFKNRKG
jgi:hypothetical protein